LPSSGYNKEKSKVLKKVLKRGFLRCGIAPDNSPPFRYLNEEGQFEGFDIDFCKALAVAIFDDDTQVEYVIPADWPDRFTHVRNGDADVGFSIASFTASRDSDLDVDFPVMYFYDNFGGYTDALSPVVAHGDQQWSDIVRWVVYGMIVAEELGVDSENVLAMLNSQDPRVRSLLGLQDDIGEKLGLQNDFMVNVIHSAGNYEEVYETYFGPRPEGSLDLLWSEGCLLYAPSWP